MLLHWPCNARTIVHGKRHFWRLRLLSLNYLNVSFVSADRFTVWEGYKTDMTWQHLIYAVTLIQVLDFISSKNLSWKWHLSSRQANSHTCDTCAIFFEKHGTQGYGFSFSFQGDEVGLVWVRAAGKTAVLVLLVLVVYIASITAFITCATSARTSKPSNI